MVTGVVSSRIIATQSFMYVHVVFHGLSGDFLISGGVGVIFFGWFFGLGFPLPSTAAEWKMRRPNLDEHWVKFDDDNVTPCHLAQRLMLGAGFKASFGSKEVEGTMSE